MADNILDRRALILVPYEIVLKVLTAKGEISIDREGKLLPTEGLKVMSVHEDCARRCFAFVVCHKTFSVTEEGFRLPELRVKMSDL